jgi:hypothetical protein
MIKSIIVQKLIWKISAPTVDIKNISFNWRWHVNEQEPYRHYIFWRLEKKHLVTMSQLAWHYFLKWCPQIS